MWENAVVTASIFTTRLKPHTDSHPETMAFWAKNQKQYDRTRVKAVDPKVAMVGYLAWMKKVSEGKSVSTMALPAAYDKMFIQSYATKFGGKSPANSLDSVGAIDIETLIMAYKPTVSYVNIWDVKDVPKTMQQPGLTNSHNPLEDTLGQMVMGVNLLRHFHKLEPKLLDQSTVKEMFDASNKQFGEMSK